MLQYSCSGFHGSWTMFSFSSFADPTTVLQWNKPSFIISTLLYMCVWEMFCDTNIILNISLKTLTVTQEYSKYIGVNIQIGLENRKVDKANSQLLFFLGQRWYYIKTAI